MTDQVDRIHPWSILVLELIPLVLQGCVWVYNRVPLNRSSLFDKCILDQ